DLLAEIDRVAHGIEEGDDGVEAGFGEPMKPAEPLDDLHLLLRNDPDGPHQHDEQKQRDAEQHHSTHTRVTSRTIPSAPTTRRRRWRRRRRRRTRSAAPTPR